MQYQRARAQGNYTAAKHLGNAIDSLRAHGATTRGGYASCGGYGGGYGGGYAPMSSPFSALLGGLGQGGGYSGYGNGSMLGSLVQGGGYGRNAALGGVAPGNGYSNYLRNSALGSVMPGSGYSSYNRSSTVGGVARRNSSFPNYGYDPATGTNAAYAAQGNRYANSGYGNTGGGAGALLQHFMP